MNLVLFGPPGCGKGTQSQFLVSMHNFDHLSTGDLIRQEISSDSELGKKVASIYSTGGLVSDDIIMQIVQKRIAGNSGKSILLDGIPRTLSQAQALDELLASLSSKVHRVISLVVPDSVLLQRIIGRFHCLSCKTVYHTENKPPIKSGFCDVCGETEFGRRSDDQEESLKVRLASYYEQTKPLEQFYKDKNVFSEVDATQSPNAVYEDIVKLITPIKA